MAMIHEMEKNDNFHSDQNKAENNINGQGHFSVHKCFGPLFLLYLATKMKFGPKNKFGPETILVPMKILSKNIYGPMCYFSIFLYLSGTKSILLWIFHRIKF